MTRTITSKQRPIYQRMRNLARSVVAFAKTKMTVKETLCQDCVQHRQTI